MFKTISTGYIYQYNNTSNRNTTYINYLMCSYQLLSFLSLPSCLTFSRISTQRFPFALWAEETLVKRHVGIPRQCITVKTIYIRQVQSCLFFLLSFHSYNLAQHTWSNGILNTHFMLNRKMLLHIYRLSQSSLPFIQRTIICWLYFFLFICPHSIILVITTIISESPTWSCNTSKHPALAVFDSPCPILGPLLKDGHAASPSLWCYMILLLFIPSTSQHIPVAVQAHPGRWICHVRRHQMKM